MSWYEQPHVLDYVAECYAGKERQGSRLRRLFLWEETDGTVYMGNMEAFTDHLLARFQLPYTRVGATSDLHRLLRALGEPLRTPRPKEFHGQSTTYPRPEPERWVAS